MVTELTVFTSSDRHDLDDQVSEAFRPLWPEFVFHSAFDAQYLRRVGELFARYDVILLDGGEQVVTGGWGAPIAWDGTVAGLPSGYDEALVRAVTGYDQGVTPDTLVIMAAAVRAGHQGSGLAGQTLTALRERAVADGLRRVIAPVRPALKSRYPLTPMDRFAAWAREDGLHVDPWIRAHQRLGAEILCPAQGSMIIKGTVAEWAEWTGMLFPESGRYVVPDALDLVEIDVERDQGRYAETNLWMRHL